jgi:hypothetical protein
MDPEQRIRERAYQIWEAEGRPDGRGFEHWRQAQEEMGFEKEGDTLSGGIQSGVAPPAPKPGSGNEPGS